MQVVRHIYHLSPGLLSTSKDLPSPQVCWSVHSTSTVLYLSFTSAPAHSSLLKAIGPFLLLLLEFASFFFSEAQGVESKLTDFLSPALGCISAM